MINKIICDLIDVKFLITNSIGNMAFFTDLHILETVLFIQSIKIYALGY